jgi:hypothetical protein
MDADLATRSRRAAASADRLQKFSFAPRNYCPLRGSFSWHFCVVPVPGELAASYLSPQQRLEAARAKVAEIEAELAALAPPPDEPSAGGANAPGGGNVVRLSRPPSAPASSPPAAPPSKPFVNGTSDLVARYAVPDEPWRQHLNASYDPWADNRR